MVTGSMKNRNIMPNAVALSGISLLITIVTYLFNLWLFSSSEYLRTRLSLNDALFIEGLVFALSGLLLLLGRGGISLWSVKAAILSATAEAVYDEDTMGPSEMFRRDRWKPRGFIRIGLILMLAGVFMFLIYFLTL